MEDESCITADKHGRGAIDRTSPEFLLQILDHIADGIYFVDRDRKVSFWNRGAEHLSGFQANEIVGRSCGDNRLVHCDGKGRNLCCNGCPLTSVLAGTTAVSAEVHVCYRDGSRSPVLVTASPVRDETGLIVGAVEVFRDSRPKLRAVEQANRAQRLSCLDLPTGVLNRRGVTAAVRSFRTGCLNSRFRAG